MKFEKFHAPTVLITGLDPLFFSCQEAEQKMPNVVFVFADEWRTQDIGYNGNTDLITPHLDQLALEGVNVSNSYRFFY